MPPARGGSGAVDPVGRFFTSLGREPHIPTFERQSARLRFEIADGERTERWTVAVHDGTAAVSRRPGDADAVVRMTRDCAEAVVAGRLNVQAALLRGLISCEGSLAAVTMFQRCLPGPPGSTGRVPPISSQAVMAQRRPG